MARGVPFGGGSARIRFLQKMSNEQIFAEFIKQQKAGVISTEWVLWMLGQIEKARLDNVAIDPQWLRVSCLVGYELPQRKDK